MGVIRYIVELGVWGTFLLAGVMITGVSGITMLEMAVRATHYFSTGGEVTESSSISFLFQFFGFWSLVIAAGLALVWFGGRGGWRRIRAGLPSADEGVGRSLGARIGLAVVFGIAMLWGAAGFFLGIVANVEFATIGFTGTVTDAKVTAYKSTDDPYRWIVLYEFRDANGAPFTGKTLAPADDPNGPRVSDLQVTYLPADPTRNDVFAPYWVAEILFFVVSRGLVALVGAWGLFRNIVPRRDAPSEPTAPVERAANPAATTRRAAVRPSFGRRSA